MEITTVSKNVIRCKGKTSASLIAFSSKDVDSITKSTEADVVIFLTGDVFVLENPKIQNYRLIISGAGEFEIGGIKISGYKTKEGYVYFMILDGFELFFGSAKASKDFDKKKEVQCAVFFADSEISDSFVTDLSASYLVLTGEKAGEIAKEFGKEAVTTTSKLIVGKDKLPEELETVVLQ